MTPDEELFRLWQQGNVAAFEMLVERYQQRLLGRVVIRPTAAAC